MIVEFVEELDRKGRLRPANVRPHEAGPPSNNLRNSMT